MPFRNKECKPYADLNGYVFVLGSDENNKTNLIKISPDGNKIETLLNDVLDGGILSVDSESLFLLTVKSILSGFTML